MIMGTETAEGEIWISPSANIGYLTQEVLIYRLIKHQKIYFLKRRLKKEEKSKFNETFRVPSFSMERAD